jgi:hypothetical protein
MPIVVTQTLAKAKPTERLLRWFIFSVVIALAPLIYSFLSALTHQRPMGLFLISGHGEILLLSAAISAAAIGELFSSKPGKGIPKLLAGGGCVTILFLASLWFEDIVSSTEPIRMSVVEYGSLAMFVSALVSSGSCIALAED